MRGLRLLLLPAVVWLLQAPLSFAVSQRETQQPQSEVEDNSQPEARVGGWGLDIGGDGTVTTRFQFKGSAPERREMLGALSRALGCPLKEAVEQGFWEYKAACEGAFHREGFVVAGEINLVPLLGYAKSHEMEWMTLLITHPGAGFSTCSVPADQHLYSGRQYVAIIIDVEKPPAKAIGLSFGYTRKEVLQPLPWYALAMLVPVLLTWWLGRGVMRAAPGERETAWFAFARVQQWTALATILLCWGALDWFDAEKMLRFAADSSVWGGAVLDNMDVWAALVLVPTMIVNVICAAVSYPVQKHVRETDWTFREILTQSVWAQAAIWLPLLLLIAGLAACFTGSIAAGVAMLTGAVLLYVFGLRQLARAMDLEPHALTVGELRDRIHALAEKAGVKLQQIYVLPARRTRLANAFAHRGNNVILTDYLLRHLSRREVDAVVGHELTHLKKKHPGLLGAIYALVMLCVMVVSPILSEFEFLPRPIALTPLILLCGLLFFFMMSRRYERVADAGSYQLTGDAEAMITGLVKLHRLGSFPLSWGKWTEKFVTHPSTVQRAKALVRQGGIPAERLPELLSPPDSGGETYAALPGMAAGEGKVFSTMYKHGRSWRGFFAEMAVMTFTPAMFAWIGINARFPGEPAWLIWTIYAIGLAATLISLNAMRQRVSHGGFDALLQKLTGRMEQQGIRPREWNGIFVGFSPHEFPRLYEGNWTWDAGFLFFEKDKLCYAGEEVKFALPRGLVESAQLVEGPPGSRKHMNVVVRWRDETTGTSGAFRLQPYGARIEPSLICDPTTLQARIAPWQREQCDAPAIEELASLQPPQIGEVSCQHPRELVRARNVLAGASFVILISIAVAFLCGLHFNLEEVLTALFRFSRAPLAARGFDGSGFYVMGSALIAWLVQLWPFFLYRDPAS